MTSGLAIGGEGWPRNPIFNREVLTLLRSRKAFVLLAIYLVLSVSVVLAPWPREASSLIVQGEISREIFSLFAQSQTLLLALLIPATLGSAMTVEKEGETIDLLLTTPITGDQILIGKLLSGMFYFVLLAVVSVPILMLCFVIGGLSATDVIGLYVVYMAQVLLFGLTSLCCSISFHRTHTAVIVAYIIVGIEAVAVAAAYGSGIGFLGSGRFFLMLTLWGGAIASMYWAARQRVRDPYVRVQKSLDEEDPRKIVGLVLRRDVFPDKWIVPSRRTDLLPDGTNIVLEKELQSGIYGSGSRFVRWVIQLGVVVSLLGVFWTIYEAMDVDNMSYYANLDRHPEYAFLCFIVAFVMTLAPALAARAFTNEKEEGTLEGLMLTLLPRREIVMGKFMAVMRVVVALTALNCVLFTIIVTLGTFNFGQFIILGMLVLATAGFSTAVGLTMSLFCRSTLAAMVGTYFVLFGIYVGPVLLSVFLTRLFPGVSMESFDLLQVVSPFLAVEMPSTGLKGQMLVLGCHLTLSWAAMAGLISLAARRFERTLQAQALKR